MLPSFLQSGLGRCFFLALPEPRQFIQKLSRLEPMFICFPKMIKLLLGPSRQKELILNYSIALLACL
ncbi:30S ribosomal protein S20 [Bacillus sp. NRRL B-14911]|nr:30S ribosomal protein S20 [Bacillus sp. NRRL B-14911]